MDAVIFDFDGVVVDSEPVHYTCFRQVLADVGINLTRENYYNKYLGYDDHDCLLVAAQDAGCELTEEQITHLTTVKTKLVQQTFRESIRALPGAAELIHAIAAKEVPLAICSGALKDEIVLAARTVGVLDCFQTIVDAKDVRRGKPDPEGYILARTRLAESVGKDLRPERCVVVEDAPAGIEAAHGAGMNVLAVATSYGRELLTAAESVKTSLTDVTFENLEQLIQAR